MSEPIVVIAYRNPLEQKIWENIGPIAAFLVICLVVTLAVEFLLYLILCRCFRRPRWFDKHSHKISIPLGFIAAFAYLWFF
jgi:hypothetical protein